jgi:iron complex outermembrane receptor protein
VSGIRDKGRLYLNDVEINNQLWENYFTYDKEMGNVDFNALLGYSYQKFAKGTRNMQFTDFRTNDLDIMINNLASANQKTGNVDKAGAIGSNSSLTNDELQSFYGRVNVGISDKYILTATLRADGSTKFGGGTSTAIFLRRL